jgi:hypothetical protein
MEGRGFKSQSGQTKYYKIGMCCFSAQHTALRRKSRLVGRQHNHVHFVLSNFGTEHNHCGFKPLLGQTKDYKNGICCFSANQAALRRKNKDWLARNQENVSKWDDMSIW